MVAVVSILTTRAAFGTLFFFREGVVALIFSPPSLCLRKIFFWQKIIASVTRGSQKRKQDYRVKEISPRATSSSSFLVATRDPYFFVPPKASSYSHFFFTSRVEKSKLHQAPSYSPGKSESALCFHFPSYCPFSRSHAHSSFPEPPSVHFIPAAKILTRHIFIMLISPADFGWIKFS